MKKTKLKISPNAIILSWSLILILAAYNAHAQSLVPCGIGEGAADCTLCHLVIGFKNIYDYLLKILFAATTLVIVIAGIMYMISSGNKGMIDKAKSALIYSLSALVLALTAWLIINAVLHALGYKNVGNWWTFTCDTTQPKTAWQDPGGGVLKGSEKTLPGNAGSQSSNLADVKCETVRNYDGFMNRNWSDGLYNEKINSVEDLKTALTNFRSKNNGLIQYADVIYQAAKDEKNNVPLWYVIGTFAHESNLFSEKKSDGTKYGCSYYNNPGCIHDPKTDKPQQYPDEITGIKENIATMGRRIRENPTPLGAWNKWYWPDRSAKNCAESQSYLNKFDVAAKATGLSGI